MHLLPSEIIKNPSSVSGADCQTLLEFYEDDLPSSRFFKAELHFWQNSEEHLTIADGLSSPNKVLKYADKDVSKHLYIDNYNGHSFSYQL